MITKKDFVESLKQVINKNDKVIVIYSGISSFLNKFPYQKNLTSEILTLIEDFITKDNSSHPSWPHAWQIYTCEHR